MEPFDEHMFASLTRYERRAQRVELEADGTVTLWVPIAGGRDPLTPVVVPPQIWRAYAQRRQRG